MWQAPNTRNRAYQSKRRQQQRKRPVFHLRRVEAELKLVSSMTNALNQTSAEVISARVILNDISEKGLGLFVSSPILVGQDVAITMEFPRRIFLKARVVFCQEIGTPQHILSENSFNYRIGLEFRFKSDEERNEMRAFCEEVVQGHLKDPPKAA